MVCRIRNIGSLDYHPKSTSCQRRYCSFHFEPQVIDQIIASGKRELAGPTLPPEGLCLEWIRYEEGKEVRSEE